MDRQLLSKIIYLIRDKMKNEQDIGNLLVASLYSLGEQLSAILYYIGHEISSFLEINEIKGDTISEKLLKVIKKYNLGNTTIVSETDEIIEIMIRDHFSTKGLLDGELKSKINICSFEAGLLAGLVEKLTNINCFAQETSCGVNAGEDHCSFIIVFQKG